MPKTSKVLSALEVGKLSQPGQYAVGGVPGLYLYIEGEARHWVLRFSHAGKRRRLGLGGFSVVTLAQAREKARAAHQLISQGIDPIEDKRKAARALELEKARAITFKDAAMQYIGLKEIEWKNAKHRQQWDNTLKQYAFPFIGRLPVAEVDQAHILAILEPIWTVKTDTAKRLRGRIETVLDWAKVKKYREGDNPARWAGHLDKLLPKPSKIRKRRHHPAVPYLEIPQAIQRIQAAPGVAAQALVFTMLTAARSVEVFGAKWSEIDFTHKLWTVPAERMKAGKTHRVPLSSQAIRLLEAQPRHINNDYIFPGRNLGKPLSNMSMLKVMRTLQLQDEKGQTAVPHGFRSSFRDWAADCTNFAGDVAEMALAHAVEDETEAAYRRGDMLQKRKTLMQHWADYCYGLKSSGAA